MIDSHTHLDSTPGTDAEIVGAAIEAGVTRILTIGTDAESSIGTAASHGCVRMRIPDVIDLYDQVPVGAPIYIA